MTKLLQRALLIYLIAALTTLLLWELRGLNQVTGDEPHYLVMASGLIHDLSLEQTKPYLQEFNQKKIYKAGLAPANAVPSPLNTHAVLGPNGLYNVHNVGLPMLLAIPYAIGGVIAAKIFMVLLGGLTIAALCRFPIAASENSACLFWAIIATAVAMPLVSASSQIYPDMVAGVFALIALINIADAKNHRADGPIITVSFAIAFLPWLQIKYSVTAILLAAMFFHVSHFSEHTRRNRFYILFITATSLLLLGAYNKFAFGSYYGPYHLWPVTGVELSKTSFMTLLGLHLDQNQGFLFQNPINFIGLIGIGLLYRRDPFMASGFTLVFLSLIVPNGLHPVWYGGWSISGRFGWSAAIVFMMPTIYALLELAERNRRIFSAVIALSVALQAYFFWLYAVLGVTTFNKAPSTWSDAYSIFYYPMHSWLPMLYDIRWAAVHIPNYTWSTLFFVLVILGCVRENSRWAKNRKIVFLSTVLLIFVGGISAERTEHTQTFLASQLPSDTGKVEGTARTVEENQDQPGFVNFGPYFPLQKGEYSVQIRYQSPAGISDVIGFADVFNAKSGIKLTELPIKGTSGTASTLRIDFKYSSWGTGDFEFRTFWHGKSRLVVEEITLSRGS